jgi:hypothetical protein
VNWRQFVVALVQALAWPAVVVLVLVVYRRRVSDLLGDNLRRFKAGPIEAEWEKVAEEARATIEAVEAVPDADGGSGEPSDVDKLLSLARAVADTNPASAVAYAYQAARQAFESHLPHRDLHEIPRLRWRMDVASGRGLVNPGAALVFERLSTLGNMSAHQLTEQTPEQAREFVELVEDFRTLLDRPTATRLLRTSSPPDERTTDGRDQPGSK